MTVGLIVLDGAARVLEINPAAARMLGLAKAPAPGSPGDVLFEGWTDAAKDAVRAVYEERRSTIASPTGMYLGVERSRLAGSTPDQTRDPLTGLHNRRHLAEQLERELGRAERDGYPVSLVMFDVDHFKEVNDTYGHGAGDEMLRAIAAELLEGTRRCDITCRYGGDEFVVVLPNARAQSARTRAERWRLRMHDVMKVIGDGRVDTTISLGVATFPENGATMDALVAAADRAVYASKSAGRDRVSVAPVPPESSDSSAPEGGIETP